jgi:hypothetical protein
MRISSIGRVLMLQTQMFRFESLEFELTLRSKGLGRCREGVPIRNRGLSISAGFDMDTICLLSTSTIGTI